MRTDIVVRFYREAEKVNQHKSVKRENVKRKDSTHTFFTFSFPHYCLVNRNQLKFPTKPVLGLTVSIATRITYVPAVRFKPVLLTVWYVVHAPVLGTWMAPVTLTPLSSMWNVPPSTLDETRVSNV